MKRCSGCGERKRLSEFHRNRRRKDGINTYCKSCSKVAVNNWRAKNPDRVKEHKRREAERPQSRNPVMTHMGLLYDPAPLLRQLELRLPEFQETEFGGKATMVAAWGPMARVFAARTGISEGAATQQLDRMKAGHRLSLETVDNWATFIGLHIDMIYELEAVTA